MKRDFKLAREHQWRNETNWTSKEERKKVGLSCMSDDDHRLLLHLTYPTRKFINHLQDLEVFEPELIPWDHFADLAERESVRLTATQNSVLCRNKVKQSLSLRVGLFKLFIYIQQKVAKLRRENGEEIGINNENQSKDTPDLVSNKTKRGAAKFAAGFEMGLGETKQVKARKSEKGKSSKKQQNWPNEDRESWEAILGIFETESRAA